MKVDAHQHFWQYNKVDYEWMGPGLESLRVDRSPQDLRPLLTAAGIDGCIAVQARQTLSESETLLALADQYAFIVGVVGWVDLRSPDLRAQLERFASHPKLVGVRHVLQDEPDDQFMLQASFTRGIGLLAEYDLAYDLLLFPKHLPVAYELVAQFPKQRFVLDHIAKPFIKDGKLAPWDEDIRCLAAFPNVYCKVSGMVTEADWQSWRPNDFRPYLDIVFAAFGPERLMFGSDWPVCTLAGCYQQVFDLAAEYVAELSKDEQTAVFGKTAVQFYGISQA